MTTIKWRLVLIDAARRKWLAQHRFPTTQASIEATIGAELLERW